LPAEARGWLARHGVSVRGARRLSQAWTAHLFVVGDVVLRWYQGHDFLDEEPDAMRKEVAALEAFRGTSVPAPRLIAWSADPPAILMTRVPGRHAFDARHPGLVQSLLAAIHGADPAAFAGWRYQGYHEGLPLEPPSWWADVDLWAAALAISANRPTAYAPVVIHRDFHPGNVLWAKGSISGVIDWGNACLGPAAFDLAHYRANLATLVGPEVVDGSLQGDPIWDIEAALGFIDPWSQAARDAWRGPSRRIPPALARERIESFIQRAVARET
jgi:aminoglycoside phosphotransferase (APT) family kinase protein